MITVARYHALIANGTLGESENIELIHGQLEPKIAKNPERNFSTAAIQMALLESVPPGWFVMNQGSLTLDDSEPEPDVMVVRGALRDFRRHHPGAADVGLVVKVANASLSSDRGVKRRLYASAGIPFYWIADLTDCRIEAYRAPQRGDYSERRDYGPVEEIPLTLDGARITSPRVSRLLPL